MPTFTSTPSDLVEFDCGRKPEKTHVFWQSVDELFPCTCNQMFGTMACRTGKPEYENSISEPNPLKWNKPLGAFEILNAFLFLKPRCAHGTVIYIYIYIYIWPTWPTLPTNDAFVGNAGH